MALALALAACGYAGSATSDGPTGARGPSGDAGPLPGAGEAGASDASDAPTGTASLTLTKFEGEGVPAQIDLSAEGTRGWVHWGAFDNVDSRNEKASAPGAIPTWALAGSTDLRTLSDYRSTFLWRDGAPVTEVNTRAGVYARGRPTFTLALDVAPGSGRLAVYAGLFACSAVATVTLGDAGSAIARKDTLAAENNAYVSWVIDYVAIAPATPLVFTWSLDQPRDSNNANVTLAAATLSDGP